MEEERIIWRSQWLKAIRELTDIELQRKAWLDPLNQDPHACFDEYMCCYFNDLGLGTVYEAPLRLGYVLQDEYAVLKNWHQELGQYSAPISTKYHPNQILEDPRWIKLAQKGKESKDQLLNLLKGQERDIFHLRKEEK